MSSKPSAGTRNSWHLAALAAIVLFSAILPISVAWGFITLAFFDKPFGVATGETKYYGGGSVRNGELWFAVGKNSSNHKTESRRFRIKRLNLTTGIETETGFFLVGKFCWPIWNGDNLFVVTDDATYKMAMDSLERIVSSPKVVFYDPILVDGCLTVRSPTSNPNEFRLVHFIDNQWVDGRVIRFPGGGSVWDEGRILPFPYPSFRPANANSRVNGSTIPTVGVPIGSSRSWSHQVVAFERHVYCLAQLKCSIPNGTFVAIRSGFDYADEPRETTSAMAPENAEAEISGWERIPRGVGGDHEDPIGHAGYKLRCNHQGRLFALRNSPQPSFCRNSNGIWEKVTTPIRLKGISPPAMLVDHQSKTSYLIDQDQHWNSIAVFRVDGNTVQPPLLTNQGESARYFRRWLILLLGLLFAWMVHVVILVLGTRVLATSNSSNDYFIGVQRARLASTWQRFFALAIDLIVFAMMLGFLDFLQFHLIFENWRFMTPLEVCNCLLNIEHFAQFDWNIWMFFWKTGRVRASWSLVRLIPWSEIELLNLVTAAVCLWVIKIYVEARCGCSLGKWIVGIRVVRSTLSPVGVARTILRGVLYCVDIPFLLTPIPGAVSLAMSDCRQRLGDRIADTIVIVKSSNQETEHHDENVSHGLRM